MEQAKSLPPLERAISPLVPISASRVFPSLVVSSPASTAQVMSAPTKADRQRGRRTGVSPKKGRPSAAAGSVSPHGRVRVKGEWESGSGDSRASRYSIVVLPAATAAETAPAGMPQRAASVRSMPSSAPDTESARAPPSPSSARPMREITSAPKAAWGFFRQRVPRGSRSPSR